MALGDAGELPMTKWTTKQLTVFTYSEWQTTDSLHLQLVISSTDSPFSAVFLPAPKCEHSTEVSAIHGIPGKKRHLRQCWWHNDSLFKQQRRKRGASLKLGQFLSVVAGYRYMNSRQMVCKCFRTVSLKTIKTVQKVWITLVTVARRHKCDCLIFTTLSQVSHTYCTGELLAAWREKPCNFVPFLISMSTRSV